MQQASFPLRYALKAYFGLNKSLKVARTWEELPPSVTYSIQKILQDSPGISQRGYLENKLKQKIQAETIFHPVLKDRIRFGHEIDSIAHQAKQSEEDAQIQLSPQLFLYSEWRKQTLQHLSTLIPELAAEIKKPMDQMDVEKFSKFGEKIQGDEMGAESSQVEKELDKKGMSNREIAERYAELFFPEDFTSKLEKRTKHKETYQVRVLKILDPEKVAKVEQEDVKEKEKEKLIGDMEFYVDEMMDPANRASFEKVINSLYYTSQFCKRTDAQIVDLLTEFALSLKEGTEQQMKEREIIQSLQRYDNDQHFLLKSYVEKKPKTILELADLLLQASQLKATYNAIQEEDINKVISSEKTDISTLVRLYRALAWQTHQLDRQLSLLPMQPLPQDLQFDPYKHAPLSYRISHLHSLFLVEKKEITSSDKQQILNCISDYNRRSLLLNESKSLAAMMFRDELSNTNFVENHISEKELQQKMINELKEFVIAYEFQKNLASLDIPQQIKMLENSEEIRKEYEKISNEVQNDHILDLQKLQNASKLEAENEKLFYEEILNAIPETKDIIDLLMQITDQKYENMTKPILEIVTSKDTQQMVQALSDKKAIDLIPILGSYSDIVDIESIKYIKNLQKLIPTFDSLMKKRLEIAESFHKKLMFDLLPNNKVKQFNSQLLKLLQNDQMSSENRLRIRKLKKHMKKLLDGEYTVKDEYNTFQEWEVTKSRIDLNSLIPKEIPVEQYLEKIVEKEQDIENIFNVKFKARAKEHGIIGMIDRETMREVVDLGLDMGIKPEFKIKRKEDSYLPQVTDPNSKNFVPPYYIRFVKNSGPMHEGVVEPEERVAKLYCYLDDMKLSKQAEKRLIAICGKRIDRSRRLLKLKASVFAYQEKNAQYLRQMLIELLREARKADEDVQYQIVDHVEKKINQEELLGQKVKAFEEVDTKSDKAYDIWRRYKKAGMTMIGADLTFTDEEARKAKEQEQKKSLAEQLGYEIAEDSMFDDSIEEEVIDVSEDLEKQMQKEFEEFE